MPRKTREWYPGAVYHVMSRGNRRSPIFKDEYDYRFFLRNIKSIREKQPFIIHALCMMTNHFHLEIETIDVEIWKIMQKILGQYAVYYNQRHSFKGHLFEGRYVSSLIEDDVYFLEVSRYIHLNPVKAMMVREPLSYEYSSYWLYVSEDNNAEDDLLQKEMSEIVETSRVLRSFGNNCREQYRMFVEGKLSHEEKELLIMKDIKEDEMWLPW